MEPSQSLCPYCGNPFTVYTVATGRRKETVGTCGLCRVRFSFASIIPSHVEANPSPTSAAEETKETSPLVWGKERKNG